MEDEEEEEEAEEGGMEEGWVARGGDLALALALALAGGANSTTFDGMMSMKSLALSGLALGGDAYAPPAFLRSLLAAACLTSGDVDGRLVPWLFHTGSGLTQRDAPAAWLPGRAAGGCCK